MFEERKVRYSALFTNLVRWHAGVVSFPLTDVILAQLACPLSDVMLCLHLGIINLQTLIDPQTCDKMCALFLTNVYREIVELLTFVYFFGQVAC